MNRQLALDCFVAIFLCVLLVMPAGCRTSRPAEDIARQVKVTAAPEPAKLKPLREFDSNRVMRMLVPSEAERVERRTAKQFVAAREAFWNRDTETAVALWRSLLTNSLPPEELKHYQTLIVDAYAADKRWREARLALEEFEFATSRSNYVSLLRFLEGQPVPSISFVEPPDVPFDLRYGQLVKAKARVNGVEANVLIDTGATDTIIVDDFARRTGLEITSHPILMADISGNRRMARLGLMQEMEFGGLRARHIPIVCAPKHLLGVLAGDVNAIIGWDLLQHGDVTWDFPSRRLSLKKPPAQISTNPVLSGRRLPLLTVTSAEGRRLDLFLDTGWASGSPEVAFHDNAGLIFTKVDGERVRWPWFPTFWMGMHSAGASWPRILRPFEFWFDGRSFRIRQATVSRKNDVREGLQTCDGMIGNAPFLGGKLRVCGVRRIATFDFNEKHLEN